MLISFGRKDKRAKGVIAELSVPPLTPTEGRKDQRQSRLIDLRSAAAFSSGFVPGSYSIPDFACLLAARALGLFEQRSVYLLAEGAEQLEMCEVHEVFGASAEVDGWFSSDVLREWQTMRTELGTLEAISADTLAIRQAGWSVVTLEVRDNGQPVRGAGTEALVFDLASLRTSTDGLPTETALCVVCRTKEMASFAASLLWNFGFHKVSYLVP